MDAQQRADRGSGAAFSPGVEGLRGVAVLLVVAFHALPRVAGGFIGVDVFFVISGYLITGLLVRELVATGRIDLVAFYGRRMRRLLPAATVVAMVVLPAGWLAVSPLDRPELVLDGGGAMLIVSNLRFAGAEGDYFAAVRDPSPFLHYWSLSLEEQFYLVWPGLLLLVTRRGRVRTAAVISLAIVGVASWAMSLWLTEIAPAWGFYALPSRAWQFALGGLLAVAVSRAPAVAGRAASLAHGAAALAGWTGLALVAVAVLAIDGSQAYPGLLALLPSIGALLVIGGATARWGPVLLLGCRPLRFLGRISYSLYLWHWPILVIPATAAGITLEWPASVALAALAVVVAWLSWRYVEEPFRRARVAGPRLTGLSLRLGTAAIAGSVLWAGFFGLAADAGLRAMASSETTSTMDAAGEEAALVALHDDIGPVGVLADDGSLESATAIDEAGGPPATDAPASSASSAEGSGASASHASASDAASASASARASGGVGAPASGGVADRTADSWTTIPHRDLRDHVRLPADVAPSLTEARTDRERLMADGCFTGLDGSQPANCVYGDRSGRITVVLIGDSHAAHWFPALNVLARRGGWRLVPLVKASCPFVDVAVLNPFADGVYGSCGTWRTRAIRIANAAHPDLVIVASAHLGIQPAGGALSPRRQGEAMADAIARLEAPVALIVDNPRTNTDVPACLARHPDDVHRCAIPRSEAVPDTFGVLETVAARRSGATLIDLTPAICPSVPCAVVRDGMILYRDGHHLTATFVRSLAPALGARLAPLLEPEPAVSPDPPATSP
jgi:peptidoglycan/LPS O-acetylase OafA/YrhL